jgi:hypothetical protein
MSGQAFVLWVVFTLVVWGVCQAARRGRGGDS